MNEQINQSFIYVFEHILKIDLLKQIDRVIIMELSKLIPCYACLFALQVQLHWPIKIMLNKKWCLNSIDHNLRVTNYNLANYWINHSNL